MGIILEKPLRWFLLVFLFYEEFLLVFIRFGLFLSKFFLILQCYEYQLSEYLFSFVLFFLLIVISEFLDYNSTYLILLYFCGYLFCFVFFFFIFRGLWFFSKKLVLYTITYTYNCSLIFNKGPSLGLLLKGASNFFSNTMYTKQCKYLLRFFL